MISHDIFICCSLKIHEFSKSASSCWSEADDLGDPKQQRGIHDTSVVHQRIVAIFSRFRNLSALMWRPMSQHLFFCEVPSPLATVPRTPDSPRQIHRCPYFRVSDFTLSSKPRPPQDERFDNVIMALILINCCTFILEDPLVPEPPPPVT